ncbi:hypothetical protein HK103_004679 [Boothiomyces macroporosus]|uniref:Uncharacterized protein n=1 Tax=Boothiomyces macroporosus TaxID=261099 RepID=A0AAD5UNZ8_9FUNG|nr:hypothetical protein HK103_004679 [Boothiomyces macroporosus]
MQNNLNEIKQKIAVKQLLSGQSLLYQHYTQEKISPGSNSLYDIPQNILDNYKEKTRQSVDLLLTDLYQFSFPGKPLDLAQLPGLYQYQIDSIAHLEQQVSQTEQDIIHEYNGYLMLAKEIMNRINTLTLETIQSDEIKEKLEYYTLIYQNIYLKQKVMETEILSTVDIDELKECGLLFDYYMDKIRGELKILNLKLRDYENLGSDFNAIVDEYSLLLQENQKLDRDLAELSRIK